MIRFLIKGLFRDRNRSLFPMVIISLGVAVSVFMHCFLLGMSDETIRSNARMQTGHLKVVTTGYEELSGQFANDLALRDSEGLIERLQNDFPDVEWMPRIKFGGLLDLPDEDGETRAQGPALGIALDLVEKKYADLEFIGLEEALFSGRLPERSGEIVMSDKFAANLGAKIGDVATLISSTANGSMAIHNFLLVGTVRFGMEALDRNMFLADIGDIQYALDMEGSTAEVLGLFPNLIFDERRAAEISAAFNGSRHEEAGELTPHMLTLLEQEGLGEFMELIDFRMALVLFTFFFVMSLVLWNAGLRGGIRRYGEIGVRLAIGESKGHVYWLLVAESFLTGIAGSIVGTGLGLLLSLYFQEVGVDYSQMMRGSEVLMSNVMRARITPASYLIGFIPGVLATLTGSAFSGFGIFKRQTAQLFKELEA